MILCLLCVYVVLHKFENGLLLGRKTAHACSCRNSQLFSSWRGMWCAVLESLENVYSRITVMNGIKSDFTYLC